jgi:hypothetical protein
MYEQREVFHGDTPTGILAERRDLGWSAVGGGCPPEIRAHIVAWRTAKLNGDPLPEMNVPDSLSGWTQDAINKLAGAL